MVISLEHVIGMARVGLPSLIYPQHVPTESTDNTTPSCPRRQSTAECESAAAASGRPAGAGPIPRRPRRSCFGMFWKNVNCTTFLRRYSPIGRSRWPPRPPFQPGRSPTRNGRPRAVVGADVQAAHVGVLGQEAAGQGVTQRRVVVRLIHAGQRQAQLVGLGGEAADLFRMVGHVPAADDHRQRPAGSQLRQQFGRQAAAAPNRWSRR